MIQNLVLVIVLLRLIDSIQYLELMYTITQGGPGTSTGRRSTSTPTRLASRIPDRQGAAVLAYVVFAVIMIVAGP